MDAVVHLLSGLAPALVYAVLGVGAALENVFPPVPADTFVLLGGFLSARGIADTRWVFVVTWLANTASALAVYRAGHRYGRPFFHTGLGRYLLDPGQLRRLGRFYERWGLWAIFFTRFLPGFRAVVPVFAGVTHQPLLPVAVPVAAASAIWYGGLVWVGATAGRNLETLVAWLDSTNRVLLAVALALAAGAGVWWYRTRKGPEDRDDDSREEP